VVQAAVVAEGTRAAGTIRLSGTTASAAQAEAEAKQHQAKMESPVAVVAAANLHRVLVGRPCGLFQVAAQAVPVSPQRADRVVAVAVLAGTVRPQHQVKAATVVQVLKPIRSLAAHHSSKVVAVVAAR
jgi:hypothetical protein